MKVPTPRRMTSGTWFIQLRLNGVSIPVTGTTEKDVTRKAQLIKAEYLAGKRNFSSGSGDLSIRQAIDKYIAAREKKLSPSTVRGYRTIQRTRFQKYMDKPISKIKDWQAVYNSDHASPTTLHKAFSLVRSSVEYVTGQPLPKVYTAPMVANPHEFLDYEQIQIFLAAVHGRACELAALFALHSLRCSEILALTWDKSIDLSKNQINVIGAAVKDETGKLVLKKTNKTESSRRTIPIFIPRLRELLETAPNKTGRVVPYANSNPIYYGINTVCKSANLPQVGIHGLRHSFASLAYHLQIPEDVAMSLGGWSDFTTMRKIYTHIAESDKAKHITALKTFFEDAN